MMTRAAAFAVAIAACLPAAGCGFAPVYMSGSLRDDGPITINEVPGKAGHFLRQELVRTLGPGLPGVTGGAVLDIRLNENVRRLEFAPDQAASRSDYVGEATYTLTAASDGKVLATGKVRESASFNQADAAYADVAAQGAAQQRVANLLARSIYSDVVMRVGSKAKPVTTVAPSPAVPASSAPSAVPLK